MNLKVTLLMFVLCSFCQIKSQNFWEQTNGPFVASEITILMVGTNDYIYAVSGGFYRSTNNGNVWTQLTVGTTNNSINAIAEKGNSIFVGTSQGVYLSTDYGGSWVSVNNGLSGVTIKCITINSNGSLFVGTTSNGIFRSTDDGNTWNPINNGLGNLYIRTLAHNSSGTIYAGTYSLAGLYRSTDNGENWIPSSNGLSVSYTNALAVNAYDDLFAVGYPSGAFRSTDNGDNWVEINNGIENPDLISLAISPMGKIYAGDWRNGVYRSDDNGESWTNYTGNYQSLRINMIGINTNEIVFAGTNKGVLQTTDYGANWITLNEGFDDAFANISTMAVCSLGYIYAASSGNGLFRSTNNGDYWEVIPGEISNVIISCLMATGNNQLFAGTAGSGIYLSTDNGISWASKNRGLTDLNVNAILKIANGDLFIGTGGGIFYSNDNGENWIFKLGPKIVTFAVGLNGYIYGGRLGGVIRSTDNGATWANYSQGLTNLNINRIDINSDGHIYATTSGGTNGGVFRSTNDGGNWVAINNGLNTTYNLNFALKVTNNDHIFLSSNFQVYRSINGGDNWVAVNWGIGLGNTVTNFTMKPNEYIFAATASGVFRSLQNTTTLILTVPVGSQTLDVESNSDFSIGDNIIINPGGLNEEINKVIGFGSLLLESPLQYEHQAGETVLNIITTDLEDNLDIAESEYYLLQNYPNPFNPVTKISFAIPQNAFVELKVFNVLGQEIVTLVNVDKPAGNYEVNFNASNLPSGVYIYKMKAGDFVQTKKMILLK